jgi:ferredoxin
MVITIDKAACQGEGKCTMICPQVFAMDDDDDKAFVMDESPEPSLHDLVRTAQKMCPGKAITISY